MKRTCTFCRQRREGCQPINNNPAVYCSDCRAMLARSGVVLFTKPSLTLIRGGKP